MPSTPRGYPYPTDADRVDIPGDMRQALEAVDGDVGGHVGNGGIHHTLGSAANQAAPGNHSHTFTAGDITGLGKQIVASGRSTVPVAPATLPNRPNGYTDVTVPGHQGYLLIAFAQGGMGVYCIGNQSLDPNYFRLTVWYDYTLASGENRYVNWMLVQLT